MERFKSKDGKVYTDVVEIDGKYRICLDGRNKDHPEIKKHSLTEKFTDKEAARSEAKKIVDEYNQNNEKS